MSKYRGLNSLEGCSAAVEFFNGVRKAEIHPNTVGFRSRVVVDRLVSVAAHPDKKKRSRSCASSKDHDVKIRRDPTRGTSVPRNCRAKVRRSRRRGRVDAACRRTRKSRHSSESRKHRAPTRKTDQTSGGL